MVSRNLIVFPARKKCSFRKKKIKQKKKVELSSSRRISSDRSNVNLRAVATYYSACVYSAVISCMVIMLYSSRTHRVYDKGGYNRKRCPLMIMNVAFMPADLEVQES